jgi:hypothetical protein
MQRGRGDGLAVALPPAQPLVQELAQGHRRALVLAGGDLSQELGLDLLGLPHGGAAAAGDLAADLAFAAGKRVAPMYTPTSGARSALALPIMPAALSRRFSRQRNDQGQGSVVGRFRRWALSCGFGARGGIRTHDLSITSQMLRVEPDGPGRILPAHVGCRVGPDGSQRTQKDRPDDHRDDHGAPDPASNA